LRGLQGSIAESLRVALASFCKVDNLLGDRLTGWVFRIDGTPRSYRDRRTAGTGRVWIHRFRVRRSGSDSRADDDPIFHMRQDNRSSTGGFRRRFSERREGVDAHRQGPQERAGSKNGVLMVAIIRSNGVPHKTPATAAGVELTNVESDLLHGALQFAWKSSVPSGRWLPEPEPACALAPQYRCTRS
jgi:hypothetical protein